MEHTRKLRRWGGFLLLLVLLVTFLIWNLLGGSVRLPASEIWAILHGGGDLTQRRILLKIRLTRLLAAMILGGRPLRLGLPAADVFPQSDRRALRPRHLVRGQVHGRGHDDPAAQPGRHVVLQAALDRSGLCRRDALKGLVLLISRRVRRMSLLVVCGVMIGYICSALTDFLVTFADDSNIVNLHEWSLGSFSGMSWDNVRTMAVVCGAALILTFLLSKPLRAYQLGEVYAQNLGVPLRAFRAALILLSSVLSACVTAFAGPISFVGIAVPHLMKSLFKSAEPLLMIPACFLGGGAFCLFCDLIARTAFAPTEVSISSVTAVFGAPVVIYMMLHRKGAQ